MNRLGIRASVGVCILAGLVGFAVRSTRTGSLSVVAAAPSGSCVFPLHIAATPEETSWHLFVAANCPTGNAAAPLAWENWPTQEQVYTGNVANGAEVSKHGQRFHPTVQGRLLQRQIAMTGDVSPKLLVTNQCTATSPTRSICEEVRLNPVATLYIRQNGLNTLTGQGKFVGSGKVMNFPAGAVEIKADWLQDCSDPNLHTETVDGKSYCLVAMHINSKLTPNWVWATWESRGNTENPNRCVTLGCSDGFGSLPGVVAAGPGARIARNKAGQTPALAAMEKSAGFAAQMMQYTLDGAQVDYMNGSAPTLLGNSVTEEELAKVPLKSSSCITCHAVSGINAAGTQYFTALNTDPIGKPPALPAGYYPRDFVWSMVVAPK